MASLGKFESLIPVTTAFTITVTDSGGTATGMTAAAAGDYYHTSSTALLSTIATNLTNNGTLAGTYSLTLDDTNDSSTGKVTLSATGGGNISVTWVGTTLRNLLGFTGNLSGAASYTGDNQAQFLWLPGCGRTNADQPLADNGNPIGDGNLVFSPGSDVSYAMSFGSSRTAGSMEFMHLLGSNTRTSLEVVVNESLETFWQSSIRKGYPVRWHPDRNVDGTYLPMRFRRMNELGVTPIVPGWVGAKSLWRWQSDFVKYT